MKLKIVVTPKSAVIEVGDLRIEMLGMMPLYVDRDRGVGIDREELAQIDRSEPGVHEFEFSELNVEQQNERRAWLDLAKSFGVEDRKFVALAMDHVGLSRAQQARMTADQAADYLANRILVAQMHDIEFRRELTRMTKQHAGFARAWLFIACHPVERIRETIFVVNQRAIRGSRSHIHALAMSRIDPAQHLTPDLLKEATEFAEAYDAAHPRKEEA